jgi:hypothetical protein
MRLRVRQPDGPLIQATEEIQDRRTADRSQPRPQTRSDVVPLHALRVP